jgi:hypothetical protein
MKSTYLRFCIILIICFAGTTLTAQNANEIIYNQNRQGYDYVGGSFVIDTGRSLVKGKKRAFLIWASNINADSANRSLALSEYDNSGNFLSQKGTAAHINASQRTLFPKKIIKAKNSHVYYLLGYIINSSHLVNNLRGYSTPVIYKIDGNTLNPIWSTRFISDPEIASANTKTVIEYNDIIETKDGNIVVVGKYAKSTVQKEYVLATKIAAGTGNLIWQYYYVFGNSCNEGANALAETTDGNLSLVGYVSRCTTSAFSGPYDMFYTQLTSAGVPVAATYKRYPLQGNRNLWADNITRYTNIAGSDKLVVSGYIDILNGNIGNPEILVANFNQNGTATRLHYIGDPNQNVAKDLIVQPIAGTTDYNLFLTGYTSNYNSTPGVSSEAFFLSLKFNSINGVTGVNELSTFPGGVAPFDNYTGRTGVEIKNAGRYQRFAILANGNYKLTTGTQTYTHVLIRDFADSLNKCIIKHKPLPTPFTTTPISAHADTINPKLARIKEGWITLDRLSVKQLCQQVNIDPYKALSGTTAFVTAASTVHPANEKTSLIVTPNPVKNSFILSTTGKELQTNKSGSATIQIYNSAMQLVQTLQITQGFSSVSITADKLKPGLYILKLSQAGVIKTTKFLKE